MSKALLAASSWWKSIAQIAVAVVIAAGDAAAQQGGACRPYGPELSFRAGEERIHKNTADVWRLPPQWQASDRGGVEHPPVGVLRRVDLPPGVKLVALTFDLCEQPNEIAGYQGRIVDFLRWQGAKATFFAGGKWLSTHPRRAGEMIADPLFEVANHSWAHRNSRVLRPDDQLNSIMWAQAAYREARTRATAGFCMPAGDHRFTAAPANMRLFRFPFGACNPEALQAVAQAGMIAVQWDVSAADPWRGTTADGMVRDVVRRTRPGSILLFHANGRGWQTEVALPRIVEALSAKGYRFVTVSELLAVPGAKPVFEPTCFDAKKGDSDRYDALARNLDAQYDQFARMIQGRDASSLRAKRDH